MRCIVIFCLLVLTVVDARSQDRRGFPEGTVRIVLSDGSEHVGHVESESEETIDFVTLSGIRMTIPRTQVVRVESVAGRRFRRSDPNESRLFFAPTARPLRHGSGYIAVYELFFPFVAVGIQDVVTLAGGVSIVPGSPEQVLYAAPKVTIYRNDRLQLGAGALVGTNTGFDGSAGLFFGIATYGGTDRSITAGAGFGFAETEFSTRPILVLAGDYQLSNNIKLITENYVIPGYGSAIFLMGGVRFFGERLSSDLALGAVPDVVAHSDGFPFFPWLGLAYNFGR